MILTLEEKLLSLLAVILFGAAAFLYGMHVGAVHKQEKWDAANARQTLVVLAQATATKAHDDKQAVTFNQIDRNYLEANAHEYPSLAPGLPAALAGGTLQLRDACPAPDPGRVSAATARSRAADAAATQALADRVKDSIAAVQAGDEADARERELDNRINALQAVLTAERQ